VNVAVHDSLLEGVGEDLFDPQTTGRQHRAEMHSPYHATPNVRYRLASGSEVDGAGSRPLCGSGGPAI